MPTPRLIPESEMRGLLQAIEDLGMDRGSIAAWTLTAVQQANREAIRHSSRMAPADPQDALYLWEGPACQPTQDMITWMRDIHQNTISDSGEHFLTGTALSNWEGLFLRIPHTPQYARPYSEEPLPNPIIPGFGSALKHRRSA